MLRSQQRQRHSRHQPKLPVCHGLILSGYDTGELAVNVQGRSAVSSRTPTLDHHWIRLAACQHSGHHLRSDRFPHCSRQHPRYGLRRHLREPRQLHTFTTARTIDYFFINFPSRFKTKPEPHSLTQLSTAL